MKPRLVIIAGPNGSGKSSLYIKNKEHEWVRGCRYICADDIVRLLGDGMDETAMRTAQKTATEQLLSALDNGEDVLYETVFSHPSKVELIKRAKEKGYFVRLLFVGTENPVINMDRIAARVLLGGHDVDARKVVSRYCRSFINCAMAMHLVDRGYMYDNSVEYDESGEKEPCRMLFRTVDGKMSKIYDDSTQWLPTYRYFLESFCADLKGP